MKAVILCLCLILTITPVVVGVTPTDDESINLVKLALGDSMYLACGLDKLDGDEQDALFSALGGIPSSSFLAESAENFLLAEGWREIQVFGYRRLTPGGIGLPDDYMIAWADGAIYILDPPLSGENLAPGFYWAKGQSSRWEIIAPNGKKLDFWLKEKL